VQTQEHKKLHLKHKKDILEDSCSSDFLSEEGAAHLNDSSFSSMNDETPPLKSQNGQQIVP
jgi:hypothetical protein